MRTLAGSDVTAWQLDGCDWWLRYRQNWGDCLRWCSYCYLRPYGWWQLHATEPGTWLLRTPLYYAVRDVNPVIIEIQGLPYERRTMRQEAHGYCTHRHYLKDAMKAAENAFAEKILRSLAGLWPPS